MNPHAVSAPRRSRPRSGRWAIALAVSAGAVLAVSFGASLAGCGPNIVHSKAEPRTSVLLVTIDTLRADHVGAYGAAFADTPTLDALARDGVHFTTAIAPTPLTLPSHVSIHTGLQPPRHGVRHNGLFRLDPGIPTLADRFRDAGYATGAVVGAIVLDARFGLDRGFDRYDDDMSGRQSAASGFPERSAGAVSEAALTFLADHADEPFFLWLHYYDPHARYRAPEPYGSRFSERPYDGEIAYVDASLGRVVDALAASGRLADTIVAVTSDHGESLGEHGEQTHGYTLYDASLAVPLILSGPGVPKGARADGVVSLVSVAPTLLAATGLPALRDVDGHDLRAHWAGGAEPPTSAVYAETLATQLDHGWSPLFAIRDPHTLYVRAPRPELYDLATDPTQQSNLLETGTAAGAETTERVARAESRLAALHDLARPVATTRLDPALRAQLDALGYMVGEPGATASATPAEAIDPKDGLGFVAPFVAARGAYLSGDLKAAASQVHELLQRMPRSARLHELAALVAIRQGQPQRAVTHADTAVGLVPDASRYRSLQGDLRLRLGDVAGALESFTAGLELDPADATLHLRSAEIAEHQGRRNAALDAYLRVIELDPSQGAAEMGAAIQEVQLGLRDDVDDRLARAGDAAGDPRLRNRLALAWLARGKPARAEALLRELLARHPQDATARHNLGRLLRDSGRAAEAARLLGPPSAS